MADSIHPAPAPDEVPRRDGVMTPDEQQEALRLLDRAVVERPWDDEWDRNLRSDATDLLNRFVATATYERGE